MGSSTADIQPIVDHYTDLVVSVREGIVEGIREGVKKGVTDGFVRGLRDGARDALLPGQATPQPVDLKAVLEDALGEALKKSAQERVKGMLKGTSRKYLRRITRDLAARLKKADIELRGVRSADALGLVVRAGRAAMRPAEARLPEDLQFLAEGIREAWEESLEESFRELNQ